MLAEPYEPEDDYDGDEFEDDYDGDELGDDYEAARDEPDAVPAGA